MERTIYLYTVVASVKAYLLITTILMCFVLAIICLTLCMPMLFSVFFFIILNYKNVSYMDFLFTTIIIFGPALFLCCV